MEPARGGEAVSAAFCSLMGSMPLADAMLTHLRGDTLFYILAEVVLYPLHICWPVGCLSPVTVFFTFIRCRAVAA